MRDFGAIEREAGTLFDDWFEQTGLTEGVLADVTPVNTLEEAQRSGRLWVASAAEDVVVGFALALRLGGLAHLDELDVLPSHGHHGVGSALLRAVCSWAAQSEYPAVTLSTFRDVPWNAPFYERRGFTVGNPSKLLQDHVRLVESERQRGLRTDRRVLMAYQLPYTN